MLNTQQAYQILALNSNSSFEDIKYSYRKMVLELHPDKNKNVSDVKFKKITEAYYFLKNHKKYETSTNSGYRSKPKKKENHSQQEFYKKTNSGQYGKSKMPEEDWSRYTQEFEEKKNWWKQYEKKFWEEYDSTTNQNTQRQEPEEFKVKSNKAELGVQVDKSLCIGCCSCETIAPEVFSVDKTKQTNPKSHVYNRKGTSNLKIIHAAETCTTKAILVDDLDAGKRIFPY